MQSIEKNQGKLLKEECHEIVDLHFSNPSGPPDKPVSISPRFLLRSKKFENSKSMVTRGVKSVGFLKNLI